VHRPVMLKEVISSLNLKTGDVVLDATVGLGGHSKEILKRILPGGSLIGLDQDRSAILIAETSLKDFSPNFKILNENFRNLGKVLSKEGIKSLDAVIFDVGVSSYQLDDAQRGFSLKSDARLDMRMDPRAKVSAYDIVNEYKEEDLADIIYRFGEERFSRRIARRIIEGRKPKPIETTVKLAEIVRGAVGNKHKKGRIDPATRTFQAIRIAVNDELNALEEGIKEAVSYLGLGARIAVISFHSLEDRIVKNLFKGYAGLGVLKIITKRPLTPQDDEMAINPRSRSAKLRIAERI